MFYYRVTTVEEAHERYFSLKVLEDVKGMLRYWISSDYNRFPASPAVKDIIECILYWRKPQHWEKLDVSPHLPVPRAVIGSHPAAWANANIIRQRWLAVERILAERHYMENSPSTSWRKQSAVNGTNDPLSIVNAPIETIVKSGRTLPTTSHPASMLLRMQLIWNLFRSMPKRTCKKTNMTKTVRSSSLAPSFWRIKLEGALKDAEVEKQY
jgi:hypothetical protein